MMHMRTFRVFAWAGLAALLVSAPAWAGDRNGKQQGAARAAGVGSVVPAETVKANVEKVTQQIAWQTSLAAAQAEAERTGKLIFWVHALGDITGLT